jgi:3' exoribonuclease family, domain 1
LMHGNGTPGRSAGIAVFDCQKLHLMGQSLFVTSSACRLCTFRRVLCRFPRLQVISVPFESSRCALFGSPLRPPRLRLFLRPVTILPDFIKTAEGSALIEVGKTRVICTASVEETVSVFLRPIAKKRSEGVGPVCGIGVQDRQWLQQPCSLDRQFLAFKEQNNAGRGVAEIFDPFEILGRE